MSHEEEEKSYNIKMTIVVESWDVRATNFENACESVQQHFEDYQAKFREYDAEFEKHGEE